MNTLNKECSEALSKLNIKGESEKWWRNYNDIEWAIYSNRDYNTIKYEEYPAYNLQETIDLLLKIGEKLGWVGIGTADIPQSVYSSGADREAHKILDIYITDGMEGVSSYLLELLKK